MAIESHQSMIVLAPPEHSRPAPPLEAPAGAEALPTRTPEEIRALEAVFAQQEKESNTVAGMVFMPMAAMVLRDILVEEFAEPADEENAPEDGKNKPKV
jgi:hypothetical protein